MAGFLERIRVQDKFYLPLTTLFFFILGSQILVNHWLIFILFSIFLIDLRRIKSVETYILLFFLFSLFASHLYIHSHYGVYGNEDTLRGIVNELLMILVVYLLGLSLRGEAGKIPDDRRLTYLLFSFFIGYTLAVIYSYFAFPVENSSIGKYGMHLYYTAVESAKHIHHSNRLLAPTIVAYGLTMMVLIIPFILFDSKALKRSGFKIIEILFWLLVALSALYFATLMGRRITIFLLLFIVVIFGIKTFWQSDQKAKIRISLWSLALLALLAVTLYTFRNDISLFERIQHEGLGDSSRVLLWKQGWHYMIEYPWGGAGFKLIHAINGRPHFYGHDAWLDIGKRFGVIPAALMVLFWLLHLRYLFRIVKNSQVSQYMKSIILVLSMAFFANWFVEPIPLSSRSFFFVTIFFLGFLKAYSDLAANEAQ